MNRHEIRWITRILKLLKRSIMYFVRVVFKAAFSGKQASLNNALQISKN